MKTIKKIMLAAALAIAAFVSASAQEECSTTWPYLYPSFRPGTVYFRGGGKTDMPLVNVHCLRGRLHYVDEAGKVKEAFSSEVLLLLVGEDKYMVVEGDVMRVEAECEQGFVAAHYKCDFSQAEQTGGAYGTSSTTAATSQHTSLSLAGANMFHMEMWEHRHSGQTVPLSKTLYLVTGGHVYKASKKEIAKQLDDSGKADFKAWNKAHKIDWNEPASILQLTDFFNR